MPNVALPVVSKVFAPKSNPPVIGSLAESKRRYVASRVVGDTVCIIAVRPVTVSVPGDTCTFKGRTEGEPSVSYKTWIGMK